MAVPVRIEDHAHLAFQAASVAARRLVRVEAGDLVAYAFLGLKRASDRWNGLGSFEGYARTIMRYEILDGLRRYHGTRKKGRRGHEAIAFSQLEALEHAHGGVEDMGGWVTDAALEGAALRLDVAEALGELAPRDEAVLRARFWQEKTLLAIGHERGVSETRGYQLVHRALEKARAIMKESVLEGESTHVAAEGMLREPDVVRLVQRFRRAERFLQAVHAEAAELEESEEGDPTVRLAQLERLARVGSSQLDTACRKLDERVGGPVARRLRFLDNALPGDDDPVDLSAPAVQASTSEVEKPARATPPPVGRPAQAIKLPPRDPPVSRELELPTSLPAPKAAESETPATAPVQEPSERKKHDRRKVGDVIGQTELLEPCLPKGKWVGKCLDCGRVRKVVPTNLEKSVKRGNEGRCGDCSNKSREKDHYCGSCAADDPERFNCSKSVCMACEKAASRYGWCECGRPDAPEHECLKDGMRVGRPNAHPRGKHAATRAGMGKLLWNVGDKIGTNELVRVDGRAWQARCLECGHERLVNPKYLKTRLEKGEPVACVSCYRKARGAAISAQARPPSSRPPRVRAPRPPKPEPEPPVVEAKAPAPVATVLESVAAATPPVPALERSLAVQGVVENDGLSALDLCRQTLERLDPRERKATLAWLHAYYA